MIARHQTSAPASHVERFEVVPAVDVLGSEAVRLRQGAFDDVSLRAGDPVALAARFAASGVRFVHLVDLDGARSGRVRPGLVARLAEAAAPASIQAAGGIRSPADAERLLEAGAARVVVGTAAFARRGALDRYARAIGDRLVVAVDARRGRVAVAGWQRDAGLAVDEAAEACAEAGVVRVLCTAIERDGMLAGPDLDLLARIRARSGAAVLASGGVATVADLEAVAATGCEGAVVGRALLDGSLDVESVWTRRRTAV